VFVEGGSTPTILGFMESLIEKQEAFREKECEQNSGRELHDYQLGGRQAQITSADFSIKLRRVHN